MSEQRLAKTRAAYDDTVPVTVIDRCDVGLPLLPTCRCGHSLAQHEVSTSQHPPCRLCQCEYYVEARA